MMGSSVLMAEAAKPITTITNNNVLECGNEDGCASSPSTAGNPLCGEVGAIMFYDTLWTKTTFDSGKWKTVKSFDGVVLDSTGEQIGFSKSLETEMGDNNENSAEVIKGKMRVSCDNGTDDTFIHEVIVSNNGKK